MKIINKNDAIHLDKPEGTKVDYYLFDEYEVHWNEQVPRSTQKWHHHEKITEIIFMIEGVLVAKWKENGRIFERTIKSGDLVEAGNTIHTFINDSDSIAKFIVFKLILTGKNNKKLFKDDKIIDE